MLLYAITDRAHLPGSNEDARCGSLVELTSQWAARGIDYIQIREKDLAPPDLLAITTEIVTAVRAHNAQARVLVNGPASIALQARADGIHLPAGTALSTAAEARARFASTGRDAVISHACHSVCEVLRAKEESQRDPNATITNTLILFAPVFEKVIAEKVIAGEHSADKLPGLGLDALHAAAEAARPIPVLALGGVTPDHVPDCLTAGAAGIAGIRLFLNNDWPDKVRIS